MHKNSSASGATSDETFRTARGPHETESEFLERQAVEAQAAMRATADELRQTLDGAWRQATDVRGLIGRHPWWSLGAAAAAGFVLGTTFTSKNDDRASRAESQRRDDFAESHERPARRSAWASLRSMIPWEMLLGPVMELAKVLAENLFAAIVAQRAAAPAPPPPSVAPDSTATTSQGTASRDEPSLLDDPAVEQATEA